MPVCKRFQACHNTGVPMPSINRRQLLRQAGAAALLGPIAGAQTPSNWQIAGRDIEIQIAPVSPHTFRLTIFPLENGQLAPIADDGSLVQASWGAPTVKLRGAQGAGS